MSGILSRNCIEFVDLGIVMMMELVVILNL